MYYPNPQGPGGTGSHEDWVMDNFTNDPLGAHAMVRTAENVASQAPDHHRRSSTMSCCGGKRSIGTRLPTMLRFRSGT